MKKIYKKLFLSIFVFIFIVLGLFFNSFNVNASSMNEGFSSWSSTDIENAFGTIRENNYNNIAEISQLKEIVLTYTLLDEINVGFLYNIGSYDNPDYQLPVDINDIRMLEVDIYINQPTNESMYYVDNNIFDFTRPVLMSNSFESILGLTNYGLNNNNWLMSLSCNIYVDNETLIGNSFSYTFWYDTDFMLSNRFKYHNTNLSMSNHILESFSSTSCSIVFPNGNYTLNARCRLVGEQDETLYFYDNAEYISIDMFKCMFDFVLPLNIPGDVANENYNIGYHDGYSVGYYEGLNTTAEDIKIPFLYGIINLVTQILDIEVFPNIKLSYFVWLPLCLGVVTLIYHFWRKD